jgi:hypothetical protein
MDERTSRLRAEVSLALIVLKTPLQSLSPAVVINLKWLSIKPEEIQSEGFLPIRASTRADVTKECRCIYQSIFSSFQTFEKCRNYLEWSSEYCEYILYLDFERNHY